MYSDSFKREYVAKSQKIIGNMIITEDNQEFISLYEKLSKNVSLQQVYKKVRADLLLQKKKGVSLSSFNAVITRDVFLLHKKFSYYYEKENNLLRDVLYDYYVTVGGFSYQLKDGKRVQNRRALELMKMSVDREFE